MRPQRRIKRDRLTVKEALAAMAVIALIWYCVAAFMTEAGNLPYYLEGQ